MGIFSNIFGQKKIVKEYQPDWTFYFSNVDNNLSSISTDLNLNSIAPIKDQENVAYVSIKMLNPKENGLSDNDEAEKLWKIEDDIIENLKNKKLNYTFVGRLTSNGLRDLYFYTDNENFEKAVVDIMRNYPDYKFAFGLDEDKTWNGYFNFLYPNPTQLQIIQNRRVVEQLEKEGDNLIKEREVFHWIYFNNQRDLEEFEKFAKSNNYKIDLKKKANPSLGYKYVISISRIDKIGYNDIDEYTLELFEKAKALNGVYDGWETSVEQ